MVSFILIKTHKKLEKRFTDRCLLMVDLTIIVKVYNVTMDHYFSSTNLADKRKAEKTTLLGTMKKQRGTKSEEMIKG